MRHDVEPLERARIDAGIVPQIQAAEDARTGAIGQLALLDLPPLFEPADGTPLIELEPTEAPAKITAYEIMQALLGRHRPPEWASFSEMRCAGWNDATRIDLFAVNTWRSQKLRSVAYEVKVSRGDFRRELNHWFKRRLAERVATECYFVAPAKMIKPSELPEGWGLIEFFSYGLRVKVRAPRRLPEPWPFDFIAMLARRTPEGKALAIDETDQEP